MNYVLDILLIAVFALSVAVGIKRGFVRSLLSMISFLLAMLLAHFMSEATAPVLYEQFVQESAEKLVSYQIDESVDMELTVAQAKEVIQNLPEGFPELAQSVGVDLEKLYNSLDTGNVNSRDVAARLTQGIVKPIAIPVLRVVSFFVLLLVISLLLRLLILLIDKIAKLPVLKTANTGLGGLLGALRGLLYVVAFSSLLTVGAALAKDSKFEEAVQGSLIISKLDITSLVGGVGGFLK